MLNVHVFLLTWALLFLFIVVFIPFGNKSMTYASSSNFPYSKNKNFIMYFLYNITQIYKSLFLFFFKWNSLQYFFSENIFIKYKIFAIKVMFDGWEEWRSVFNYNLMFYFLFNFQVSCSSVFYHNLFNCSFSTGIIY